MRRTAGYTWTDYKTNSHIAKELEITPVLDRLLEYKRNRIQHVNRMPRDRLPRIMKHYSPTGRRNRGWPLKRLLDTWDRNGSTSSLTPWLTYDDDYVLWSFKNKEKHFVSSLFILHTYELFLWGHLLFVNCITTGTDMCQEFRYALPLRLPHYITTRTLLWRGQKLNVLPIVTTIKQINIPSKTVSKTNDPGFE